MTLASISTPQAKAKARIKQLARSTFSSRVLREVGAFGGFFSLQGLPRDAVLVSSVDGVGTKLKLAFALNRHDTVGADLVNHCVNDIAVHGAAPLFFLDYRGDGQNAPQGGHRSRQRSGRRLPQSGLRAGGRRDRGNAGLLPRG